MLGLLWLWGHDALVLSPAREHDGEKRTCSITVSDYAVPTDYGYSVTGQLQLDNRSYQVCFYIYTEEALAPGDVVEGVFSLRYTAPGGEEPSSYYPGKGIFLLAYLEGDAVITQSEEVPAKYFAAKLRKHVQNILDAVFPTDTLAFARALLLGDSSMLSYETDTDFQISGIRHVIAVSGLHVSILFSLIYLFAGKRRFLTALLGIPMLLLFAAVAGFTPSIVRACVMQCLMILALLFKKEYDPPTALAFAVLVMLTANPLTIKSVSFQLSVGCVIGIFLFSGKANKFLLSKKCFTVKKPMSLLAKLVRWFTGSVSVSLSAMVLTTPLCAVYFGMVSIIGILTNLLTLWVISFVFYGIMASCIVGAIYLPLGRTIAWFISWPIRYVLATAKALASLLFSAVYTCSVYIVIWLVMCYALFAVFMLCKKKYPILFSGCVSAALILALVLSWFEPKLDDYRLTVFDVGQGQCILLQSQGKTYLVDCGGDSAESAADTAAAYLLSQGISALDGMIITHFDADHVEGAQLLLTRINAGTLYLPATSQGDIPSGFLKENQFIVTDKTVITAGTLSVTLIPGEEGESDNESGLSILFQTENCDILITGDMDSAGECALLEKLEIPDLEILIVGHHGSAYSTGQELLSATNPETAVISVGADNRYGHPAQTVLKRLTQCGCQIRRTDLEGTILIRG